jgi:hypothetical protein
MAQIFHRSTNTLSKVSIFGAIFIIAALALIARQVARSAYVTGVGEPRDQPIQFSHEHHVGGIGIDCRYCHTSVEESSSAGMPPTKTCMNCHSQVWADSPFLEPVRASFRDNKPIHWRRVNDLPDFVYFDHSIHVKKGVACVVCHGRVDQMPLMWQQNTLLMEWCLDCHRQPSRYIGPREEVFTMRIASAAEQQSRGPALMREYHVEPPSKLTNCSVCHR